MNFYPIYKNKKLLPWIKWWLIKGNKVMPKHLSEWINSAEAITLTGVYKGSPLLNLNLNGNTSQTGTPTPEAPVPVNVVKGNNTIKINDTDYQVNLKSKNLFDKDNATILSLNGKTSVGVEDTFTSATYQKHIYISCKPNTTYTVTKGTTINSILGIYETTNVPAVGVAYKVLYFSSNNNGTKTITTGTNAKYLDVRITTNVTSEADIQTILESIQIEEGTTATPYEPYYDYELCKIGDYQDVIYKENNKYYVEKHIGKHEIASSDIALISTYWYSTYGVYGAGISKDFLNIEKTITDKQSLCNISSKVNAIASISNAKYIFTANANYVFFFSNTSDTLDKAKAELTGGIIYYNLETSTTTEITESNLISQLEAIYNAKLQSGTNTITQTPEDLPFYLNFQYYEKG